MRQIGSLAGISAVDNLFSFYPATVGIWIYLGQLTGANFILSLLPEINIKQIGMVFQKYLLQRSGQLHKILQFLRENIIFIHVKPGFGGHFIIRDGWWRQFPEIAACQ